MTLFKVEYYERADAILVQAPSDRHAIRAASDELRRLGETGPHTIESITALEEQ